MFSIYFFFIIMFSLIFFFFFFQAEDGIRDADVTGVQTCALPIYALKPVTKRFIGSVKPHHQFSLGMLWGFLPCGLIYSALAWVAAEGNPTMGAATMFAFGLGTLPALTAGTLLGNVITPWLNKPIVRKLS